MESLFPSLKADVIHGRWFEMVAEFLRELQRHLGYYNHRPLHSALSYQSPVDYEQEAA